MEDVLVEPRAAGAGALAERFHALYRTEYGRVAGYAYRLTRDAEQANDIAQEAFTRLLSRFVGVREPKAYVFHVATNLARSAWNARVRADRVAPDLVGDGVQPAHDTTVADAIARLPRRYREVVLLHYYADLAVADVAEVVRRPTGTVKRQLAEARALLADSLGDRHE